MLVDITCTMILVQIANCAIAPHPQMAWGIRDGRVQGLSHKSCFVVSIFCPTKVWGDFQDGGREGR